MQDSSISMRVSTLQLLTPFSMFTDHYTVYRIAFESLPLIQDDDLGRSSELAMDLEWDAADDALGEASDLTEASDDELGP
jgi:hypothetical protein